MYDVVIVDTAGRLGVDAEMMQQAADIRDAVNPDEILFVVDAMIGQDAVTTAQAFLDGVGFNGVVLDQARRRRPRWCGAVGRQVTGRPIMFASNGEKLADFDTFHPDRMASRILGMGDMLTLIEQAEKHFDADQAEEMAAKLAGRRLHPRGLPAADEDASARWARSAGCSACCPAPGRCSEALGERRRPRHRPHRRDHPVDDAGGAGRTRRSSTPPAGSASPRAPAPRCPHVNALVERFFEAQQDDASRWPAGSACPGAAGEPASRRRAEEGQGQGPVAPTAKAKGSPAGNPAKRRDAARQAAAVRQPPACRAASGSTSCRPASTQPSSSCPPDHVTVRRGPPAPCRPATGEPVDLWVDDGLVRRRAGRRRRTLTDRVGCCRVWSTRTATSG